VEDPLTEKVGRRLKAHTASPRRTSPGLTAEESSDSCQLANSSLRTTGQLHQVARPENLHE
jgi:hypothetical protein